MSWEQPPFDPGVHGPAYPMEPPQPSPGMAGFDSRTPAERAADEASAEAYRQTFGEPGYGSGGSPAAGAPTQPAPVRPPYRPPHAPVSRRREKTPRGPLINAPSGLQTLGAIYLCTVGLPLSAIAVYNLIVHHGPAGWVIPILLLILSLIIQ